MALLGPNGAGKSTLLRILASTVLPDSGSVHIRGRNLQTDPYLIKQNIGFVLGDERSFYWRLTAKQNLRFFATLSNLRAKPASRRIDELSELLGIEKELHKPFRDLSTGMRQRLAIARALLHNPDILLVDEPTRGLDPEATQKVQNLLRHTLSNQLQKTVLFATHNLEETRRIADHIAALKEGRLIMHGNKDQIMDRLSEIFDLEQL